MSFLAKGENSFPFFLSYTYTSKIYLNFLTELSRFFVKLSNLSQFNIFHQSFQKGFNKYEVLAHANVPAEMNYKISRIWEWKDIRRWLRLGLTHVTLQVLLPSLPQKGRLSFPTFLPLKKTRLLWIVDWFHPLLWEWQSFIFVNTVLHWRVRPRWHMTLWPESSVSWR